MKIAVVGSRNYPHLDRVEDLIKTFDEHDIVVTGGAIGVDLTAEIAARNLSLGFMVFLPNWKKYGLKAGPIRNRRIVEESEKVYAFWDGISSGTFSTINLAKRLNRPVVVIEP